MLSSGLICCLLMVFMATSSTPILALYTCMGITISCGYVQLHGNHHFMWPCTPAWTSPFHAALQGHSLHKTQTGHRPEQRWSRVYIQLADSIATYFAWAYEQKQRTSDKTGYFAQLTWSLQQLLSCCMCFTTGRILVDVSVATIQLVGPKGKDANTAVPC